MATETLKQGLERFRIAYQSGLAKDIEPLSKEAVAEGEALLASVVELEEVANWAQAVLTALNAGNIQKESPIHKKLREVMITFRNRTGAPGSACWLIERGQAVNHSPTIWWCGGDERASVGQDEMENWTDDALKARRFQSRADAESLAARILGAGTFSILEHIFLGGAMMRASND